MARRRGKLIAALRAGLGILLRGLRAGNMRGKVQLLRAARGLTGMPVAAFVHAPSLCRDMGGKLAVGRAAVGADGLGLAGRRTAGAVLRFGVAAVLRAGAGMRPVAVGGPLAPLVGVAPVGINGVVSIGYGRGRLDLCAAVLFRVPAVEVIARAGGIGQRTVSIAADGGHAFLSARAAVRVKGHGAGIGSPPRRQRAGRRRIARHRTQHRRFLNPVPSGVIPALELIARAGGNGQRTERRAKGHHDALFTAHAAVRVKCEGILAGRPLGIEGRAARHGVGGEVPRFGAFRVFVPAAEDIAGLRGLCGRGHRLVGRDLPRIDLRAMVLHIVGHGVELGFFYPDTEYLLFLVVVVEQADPRSTVFALNARQLTVLRQRKVFDIDGICIPPILYVFRIKLCGKLDGLADFYRKIIVRAVRSQFLTVGKNVNGRHLRGSAAELQIAAAGADGIVEIIRTEEIRIAAAAAGEHAGGARHRDAELRAVLHFADVHLHPAGQIYVFQIPDAISGRSVFSDLSRAGDRQRSALHLHAAGKVRDLAAAQVERAGGKGHAGVFLLRRAADGAAAHVEGAARYRHGLGGAAAGHGKRAARYHHGLGGAAAGHGERAAVEHHGINVTGIGGNAGAVRHVGFAAVEPDTRTVTCL